MDPVAVRPATAADAEALDALRAAARAAIGRAKGGPMLLADLDATAADPTDDGDTFVGTIAGEPVGYSDIVRVGERARIRELWVDPAARAVGVGRALLATIDTWARSGGATVVDSQVLPGDRASKNFFEAEGMVSRLLVVSRRIGHDA